MIKYKNKKEKGITLVALVITIIILLILAGISIQTLTQTGLFENAKQAKNATENAQKYENYILVSYENEIIYINNSNRENEKNSSIISEVKFEVKDKSTTYIEIAINPTATNIEDILGYHIIAIDESDNTQVNSKMSTEKTIKLEGLKANTKYDIFVAAYDKFNNVRYSQTQKVQTCQEFDFKNEFETITLGTTGKYYGLSGNSAYFITELNNEYWKNQNPFLSVSDTNSYANLYTINKLEKNFKSIEIYARTRNDGKNDALFKWGLVSKTGNDPIWLESATKSMTCATTSSFVDYKETIKIPEGVNTTDYYLQMYFKHNGSSYSMIMEFMELKGIY